MKVLITGSSGMIGGLILNDCLQSGKISEVVSLVRNPGMLKHEKLTEIIVKDFEDYSPYIKAFKNVDVAFFCIGVYTGKVPDELFKKITVDYAVNFAAALKENSPKVRLCLLSGAGADRKEKSGSAFARYKGMAENQISALRLKFHTFRPGYIYPVSTRKEPNFLYRVSRILYPLIKMFGQNASIKSTELAEAMFNVGINGADQQILENRDILKYA